MTPARDLLSQREDEAAGRVGEGSIILTLPRLICQAQTLNASRRPKVGMRQAEKP